MDGAPEVKQVRTKSEKPLAGNVRFSGLFFKASRFGEIICTSGANILGRLQTEMVQMYVYEMALDRRLVRSEKEAIVDLFQGNSS
jgi:hypothetical protein